MPISNHLFYLNDSTHHEGKLLYWNIDNQSALKVLEEINSLFYHLYQTPLRLNSWITVLSQLFNALDFDPVLPATKSNIAYLIQTNPSASANKLCVQTDRHPTSKNLPINQQPVMMTIVNLQHIATHYQADPSILNDDQLEWLNNFFLGRIKFQHHG